MAHEHDHHHPSNPNHTHHQDQITFDPVLTFGPAPFVAPVPLQAGPVQVWFDPEWGFLRRICLGPHEVVRAIYGAVRSDKWATARPRLENLKIDNHGDHFQVSFTANCRDDALGIDFSWVGTLTGEVDGTITYDFDGTAAQPFKSNRTGLCLLHPGAACAGRSLTIDHVDGTQRHAHFPTLISPHQPFFGIRSLSHQVGETSLVTIVFTGDTFEMEDQRNWSDASFKTYSGALAVPIPHSFPANHRVHQTIKISFHHPTPIHASRPEPVRLTLPEKATRQKPNLGTRWAPEAAPLSGQALHSAQQLRWNHLLVELNLTESTWADELARGLAQARALEAQLLLRLTLTANHAPVLAQLAALVPREDICGLVLLEAGQPSTPISFIRHVLRGLEDWSQGIPVASTSPLNFADLNRYRPSDKYGLAMPLCPQVHTFDHQSIMENLESQPAMIETIRSFNSHPIWVSPIALLRRRVADPRQASLFAGAYTIGTLAQLATRHDVELLTFYEHTGKNGILDTPVEKIFSALALADGIAPVTSSDPERVRALALFDHEKGTRTLMLANMTFHHVQVTFGPTSQPTTLELAPYAFSTMPV